MICPNCGYETNERYCGRCGYLLDPSERNLTDQEPADAGRTKTEGTKTGVRLPGRGKRKQKRKRLRQMSWGPAAGLVVLCDRIMQVFSCILMAYMVLMMAFEFWGWKSGLGNVRMIAEDRNYGLAFYLAAVGGCLLMGVIWCFWILSRKAVGGGDRLKLYDTGRGLIPFLLCGAAVFAVRYAIDLIPVSGSAWHGIAGGIQTFFAVLNLKRDILLFCCVSGAALSLIRKIIRM